MPKLQRSGRRHANLVGKLQVTVTEEAMDGEFQRRFTGLRLGRRLGGRLREDLDDVDRGGVLGLEEPDRLELLLVEFLKGSVFRQATIHVTKDLSHGLLNRVVGSSVIVTSASKSGLRKTRSVSVTSCTVVCMNSFVKVRRVQLFPVERLILQDRRLDHDLLVRVPRKRGFGSKHKIMRKDQLRDWWHVEVLLPISLPEVEVENDLP